MPSSVGLGNITGAYSHVPLRAINRGVNSLENGIGTADTHNQAQPITMILLDASDVPNVSILLYNCYAFTNLVRRSYGGSTGRVGCAERVDLLYECRAFGDLVGRSCGDEKSKLY